jgi:hypothetical protein
MVSEKTFACDTFYPSPFQVRQAEPFPAQPIVHPLREANEKNGSENDFLAGQIRPPQTGRGKREGQSMMQSKCPKAFALYIFSHSLSRFFSRF